MSQTRDTDFVILMNAIATSCKLITSAVNRAGVAKLYGLAGEVNSTGDDQKKLDVISNVMMINALVHSGVCSILVSEENEDPIIVPISKAGKVRIGNPSSLQKVRSYDPHMKLTHHFLFNSIVSPSIPWTDRPILIAMSVLELFSVYMKRLLAL
jgi:hypothetical protein